MTSKLYKNVNNQKEDIFENTSNDRRELTEVLTEWSVGRREGLEICETIVDEISCNKFLLKLHTEETLKKHFSIFDKITEEFLKEWQS